ncbi:MAG TPA: serine/threonine-protein kinase [Gemmatimonadaceae bacterium]
MAPVKDAVSRALAGRFRLERELGRGGWGIVYLATDLQSGRSVAIKVLREEVMTGLARERFLREIRYATSLSHPNLVPILESGEADGLLYCVMPCIEGQTLTQLIQREQLLPVSRAVEITTQIASALAYVHSHGIVHRDIKPANIVFDGDTPMLTDFGIARAVEHSTHTASLTVSGVQIGTPAYMSPEQGSADHVDARSDIYSLGCVLYEMLAGTPPFTGPTTTVIAARHALDPVPPLRTVRRNIPAHVDAAVLRALEKVPADRFQTAEEFAAALTDVTSAAYVGWGRRWRQLRRRPVLLASVAAGVVLAAAVGLPRTGWFGESRADGAPAPAAAATADTSRYVLFPMQRAGAIPGADALEQLLRDAINRWSGLSVVDEFQVRDALARRGTTEQTPAEIRGIALQLGAGRYVRGSFSASGDSVRIHTILFDAASDTHLREAVRRIHRSQAGADSVARLLADELLFRDGPRRGLVESDIGTASLPARQAFWRGLAAIEEWDVATADSLFARAAEFDPDYAQAHLWQAQVRFWLRQPVPRWEYAAQAAGRTRERLGARDQTIADALLAFAAGDRPRACSQFQRLTAAAPNDFAVWYGSGMCQIQDGVVVPAPGSLSGWRFRTSYANGLRHLRRAFTLLPSIHVALRADSYRPVRALLMTSTNSVRRGQAQQPDTTTFVAMPSWEGDSLAFHPFPATDLTAARPETMAKLPTSVDEAVFRQRGLFRDVATFWATAFPENALALQALAISLEMLGNAAALDTLHRARTLARTRLDSVEIAATEFWARLRLALPADVAGLRRAAALGDSLLGADIAHDTLAAGHLTGIATVMGRAAQAAQYARMSAVASGSSQPPSAPSFLAYAALGGPRDSIVRMEAALRDEIERRYPPTERRGEAARWIDRGASLVFPDIVMWDKAESGSGGDYLLGAQLAWLRRDTSQVRRILSDLSAARTRMRVSDPTPDAALPEATLLALTGDSAGAAVWLDGMLRTLGRTNPELLASPVNGGAAVRAMALRASLAAGAGDEAMARTWGSVVSVLWDRSDDFLQPTVRRMRALGGVPPHDVSTVAGFRTRVRQLWSSVTGRGDRRRAAEPPR